MINLLIALILLGLLLFVAAPIIFLAVPGILLLCVIYLFFIWLDKVCAEDSGKHDDQHDR